MHHLLTLKVYQHLSAVGAWHKFVCYANSCEVQIIKYMIAVY